MLDASPPFGPHGLRHGALWVAGSVEGQCHDEKLSHAGSHEPLRWRVIGRMGIQTSATGEPLVSEWIGTEWALLQISVVLFLVLLNGFFVASEFAIVKVRDSQIASLANQRSRGIT